MDPYSRMGLGLRHIFDEMPNVAWKDELWPKSISDNARRVFRLG